MSLKIISIEGNIGSGKTTLLSKLKEKYANNKNIVFLKEPVDDWATITDINGVTMLEKFYANQKEYAFSFQMMAYISRLALFKNTIQENPGAIIITERSLNTDREVFAKMLYDTGFIELVNYKIYLKWFDTFARDCPISKVIYVNTDPQICFDRIKKRSRTGESSIPLDYLENCHKYHGDMLDATKDTCVCKDQIVFDGNIDIFQNEEHLQEWMEEIVPILEKVEQNINF
jgi:deoxyadenosine/deoxycytidine kinase